MQNDKPRGWIALDRSPFIWANPNPIPCVNLTKILNRRKSHPIDQLCSFRPSIVLNNPLSLANPQV